MSKEELDKTAKAGVKHGDATIVEAKGKKEKAAGYIAPKPVPELESEPKKIKNIKTGAKGTAVRIHKGNERLDRVEVNCDGKIQNLTEKKFRAGYEFI